MENLHLPASFRNVVISSDIVHKQIVIRSNVKDVAAVKLWVQEYSENTATSYILRSSRSGSQKVAHLRLYLCHHASYNKTASEDIKRGKSKNYECTASLKILVKHVTKKTKATDPYIKEGLMTVITINNHHSHPTGTIEAISQLRPTQKAKEKFIEYFEAGHTASSAMNECNLNVTFSCTENSNAHVNPKPRTVRHWYQEWLKDKYGSLDDTCITQLLKSQTERYRSNGDTILVNENPFAVAIITPLMRRAHRLSSSADVAFLDSSDSRGKQSHVTTVLLTTCAIGTVPLGIFITKGRSVDDYKAGLQLLNNDLADEGFYRQTYPYVIMTDDEAKHGGLSAIWPKSILLLCQSHLCRSVWRWLRSTENSIPRARRSEFHQQFNRILTSITENEALENYIIAKEGGKDFKYWLAYLEDLWQNKEKWCLAWRDKSARSNQCNYYNEITIRLLKKRVLNKCKARNVVELVRKIVNEIDQYYVDRLKNFVHRDNDTSRLLEFEQERKNAEYLTLADVISIDENLYIVRSEFDRNTFFLVDPGSGFCSCTLNESGVFCEHMAGVFHFYNHETFLNLPSITPQSEHDMAALAFSSNESDIEEKLEEMDQENEENRKILVKNALELFREKLNQFHCSEKIMKLFMKRCREVSTVNAMKAFLTNSTNRNLKTRITNRVRRVSSTRRKVSNLRTILALRKRGVNGHDLNRRKNVLNKVRPVSPTRRKFRNLLRR